MAVGDLRIALSAMRCLPTASRSAWALIPSGWRSGLGLGRWPAQASTLVRRHWRPRLKRARRSRRRAEPGALQVRTDDGGQLTMGAVGEILAAAVAESVKAQRPTAYHPSYDDHTLSFSACRGTGGSRITFPYSLPHTTDRSKIFNESD